MTGLQEPLMVIRTILAAPTRMMDEAWRRVAYGDSPIQARQRQAFLQPVIDSPANDASLEEIGDDGEVQSALGGPDSADIDTPLLASAFTGKVPVQKVGGDRPCVIAVRGFS